MSSAPAASRDRRCGCARLTVPTPRPVSAALGLPCSRSDRRRELHAALRQPDHAAARRRGADRQLADGLRGEARPRRGGRQCRRHRPGARLDGHRRRPGGHQADPRPHRPPGRREPADRLRARRLDRRHARRRGHPVRHHLGRLADGVHAGAQAGRDEGAPRRDVVRHRQRGGRRRGRRPRRRGHRGCRPEGPGRGRVVGAAPPVGPQDRSPDDRSGRDRRRRVDGEPRSCSAPRACRWAPGCWRRSSRTCTTG